MTITVLCKAAGMSKQNFYKDKKARQKQAVDEELVCDLIGHERHLQPEAGIYKIFLEIKPALDAAGVKIGRDKIFKVAGKRGLLLKGKRRKNPQTTDSRHGFRKYGNLLKDRVITGPNEAWVCDITYIRTDEGFLYLSLIMDAFSRKVVGYHGGDSLEVSGCLGALKMAIEQLPPGVESLIHHSDRGSQYCCNEYTALEKKHGIEISMTEENHCYENAMAERLNGILKQEFYLGDCFRTKSEALRAIKEAIRIYNTHRRHRSLGMRKPKEVHAAPVPAAA